MRATSPARIENRVAKGQDEDRSLSAARSSALRTSSWRMIMRRRVSATLFATVVLNVSPLAIVAAGRVENSPAHPLRKTDTSVDNGVPLASCASSVSRHECRMSVLSDACDSSTRCSIGPVGYSTASPLPARSTPSRRARALTNQGIEKHRLAHRVVCGGIRRNVTTADLLPVSSSSCFARPSTSSSAPRRPCARPRSSGPFGRASAPAFPPGRSSSPKPPRAWPQPPTRSGLEMRAAGPQFPARVRPASWPRQSAHTY